MNLVYLAGPITGLSFDGANDWRIDASKFFADRGVKALSPLRNKEYLKSLGELSATCAQEGAAGHLSTPRAIMTRDHFDCTRSTVVLVNLIGATRVSIGTVMEMAWAFQARVPLVVAIEREGNVHEHAMVQEAIGFRCNSLEQALATCVAVIG